MPIRTIIPRLFGFHGKTIFTAIFFTVLLAVNSAQSQSNGAAFDRSPNSKSYQSTEDLLPNRLGEQWRAVNQAQTLDERQFSNAPDADVYKEYGLQKIISRNYTNGKTRASIEVFELSFISNAFGLFTFNRGKLPPNAHEYHKEHYVIRVSTPVSNEHYDQYLFEAIKPNLVGGVGQLPSLTLHLPERDKIAETEKYIVGPAALTKLKNVAELKNAINFDVGVEVATADYNNGNGQMSLIIIEYHTPQLASDRYAQIQGYFDTLSQDQKDRRILKRVGNYIVAALNVQDMPAAQNIVGQIKYQTKVYWAGRKLSDIPLEFRPPDPVAIEEQTRTIQVLLRSFYWLGTMLLSAVFLGLVAGGLLFYWNRRRRHKLGLDDMFSDAGGTVRLNLDDYLLSDDSQAKRIEKGNN